MDQRLLELLLAGGAGVVFGALLAWLVARARATHRLQAAEGAANAERAALQERLGALESRLGEALAALQAAQREAERLREQLGETRGELARVEERARRVPVLEQERLAQDARMRELTEELGRLRTEHAELRTQRANELQAAEEKLALLAEARTSLSEQFKNLASEILEDKSRRFTELNQANLGQLLDPLRSKITEFQAKVEQVYDAEGKERVVLADQVRRLFELNQQISKEANDLTRALKGSVKAQGNWGERVLESLLELAGLQRDQQYVVQESHQREDGSRAQPDVVVHMPEGRRLVVDAKVSLTAYEDYASAPDDGAREAALKRHLESVRAHVRGLHERDYQALHGAGSYDFVLMFVAVEPAFMLAVTQDRELFEFAWSRNVLLVSPSTLLFVLRTVAQLWRQDAQNRNALEISKRGAELYDKLVLFVESLEGVGQRLAQAQTELDNARTRLAGKGGALRQAEMLYKLGVKPRKQLPAAVAALVSEATEEEEAVPGEEGEGADAVEPGQ